MERGMISSSNDDGQQFGKLLIREIREDRLFNGAFEIFLEIIE